MRKLVINAKIDIELHIDADEDYNLGELLDNLEIEIQEPSQNYGLNITDSIIINKEFETIDSEGDLKVNWLDDYTFKNKNDIEDTIIEQYLIQK